MKTLNLTNEVETLIRDAMALRDSVLIYKVPQRKPRRVFYIDVGNAPIQNEYFEIIETEIRSRMSQR